MTQPKREPNDSPRFREIWVELRTENERIEGVVRAKADAKCRRIGDIIAQADRDSNGILHLVHATVFDARTNEVKFHRSSLGISRKKVLFAAPLEMPSDSALGWSLPPKRDKGRSPTPDLRILDELKNN